MADLHLKPRSRQAGVALVISLIILLMLTVLGVQGLQTVTLEEKMAGNFRDRQLAFEAAEAALRAGENWINAQNSPPVAAINGANNVWTFGDADITNRAFWANGIEYSGLGIAQLSENPRYIIEERGELAGTGRNQSAEIGANTKGNLQGTVYGYRITARGLGGTANSIVILQSNYEKIY